MRTEEPARERTGPAVPSPFPTLIPLRRTSGKSDPPKELHVFLFLDASCPTLPLGRCHHDTIWRKASFRRGFQVKVRDLS